MSATPPHLVKRILAFVAPVALGALALVMMQRGREQPKRRPLHEQGRPVRVLTVSEYEAVPRAVGYGVVRSQREWQLVAEVSGRVIEINDDLETGRIIREGEKLLKIDPQDYKISATQQKATVANARAQLSELGTKERNTKASLAIAQRALELARKDYERTRQLYDGGNATAAEVDSAEQQVLTQQSSTQTLKNSLAEIPSNRRALRAQIDQFEAGVAGAELEIARTELLAPFDVRISAVNVELSELVSVGTTLAEGDGIAVAEVPAQFAIGSLQPLVASRETGPVSTRTLSRLRETNPFEATVRLESGGLTAHWKARFDRFANVDSETRTVAVIVTVDEPFARVDPGRQPPLVSGMYVEVELEGRPLSGCRAVPRAAVRGEKVRVVGEGNRLKTREVSIAFLQDDYACIEDGLEPGERVVLTELVPAIEGMLLDPRDDEHAVEAVAKAVRGKAENP